MSHQPTNRTNAARLGLCSSLLLQASVHLSSSRTSKLSNCYGRENGSLLDSFGSYNGSSVPWSHAWLVIHDNRLHLSICPGIDHASGGRLAKLPPILKMPTFFKYGGSFMLCHAALLIQSSHVIILSRYYLWHCNDSRTTWIRLEIHNRHPIPRPKGRAMGGLFWGFCGKVTTL